jgi:hypothetical protein
MHAFGFDSPSYIQPFDHCSLFPVKMFEWG